ncbi:YceI family protein [Flammeovirga pectinis]|uniref:YceI family protein n=1 Tax=Flammeovirga pectinis TaxID=2494373 RepID=A0A3Q9FKQ4_9BACT|nr:YceI family protein [Flammeovirga pectinis]AZQ61939.1 YceI family protein [Flammeovirga pectinis]
MKNIFNNVIWVALIAIAASCGTSSNKTEKSSTTKTEATEAHSHTHYSYDPAATVVSFTAFKTTDKVGVNGKFEKFDVKTQTTEVENAIDILNGLSFSIPVNSVETNDKSRNGKIVKYFFGTLANTADITGVVKSVNAGKALVAITMNGITKDVELTAKADKNVVVLKGVIDVVNWNGMDAINALNKICYDLHKGADGKSKLWSDVDLFIKAKLATK